MMNNNKLGDGWRQETGERNRYLSKLTVYEMGRDKVSRLWLIIGDACHCVKRSAHEWISGFVACYEALLHWTLISPGDSLKTQARSLGPGRLGLWPKSIPNSPSVSVLQLLAANSVQHCASPCGVICPHLSQNLLHCLVHYCTTQTTQNTNLKTVL